MTVATSNRSITYIGDGVTTIFPYSFRILDASQVSIILTEILTGDEIIVPSGQYSITGLGTTTPGGGDVTYPLTGSPLSASFKISIIRTVPYLQELDITNEDGFYPTNVELQMDKEVMQIQQLADELDRAPKMPFGNSAPSFPTPEDGKFIGWNGLVLDNLLGPAVSSVNLPQTNDTIIGRNIGNSSFFARRLFVNDVPELVGLNTSNSREVFLKDEDRSGVFQFDPTDLSAEVAIDEGQGDFIAPAADLSGAGGAWKRTRKNGDLFKTSEFGGGIVGLRAAMAVASLRFGGGTVEISEKGTIGAYTAGFVWPRGIRLVGQGESRFDCSGIPDVAALANGYFIDTVGPDTLEAQPVFSSVSENGLSITFTVPGHTLQPGDVINIYDSADFSFLSYRSYYRAGEINRVWDVDGDTAHCEFPFQQGYTGGSTVTVYKVPTRKVGGGGFIIDFQGNSIVSTSGTRGMRAKWFEEAGLEDVKILDTTYMGVFDTQCLKWHTKNVTAIMKRNSLGGGNPTNQYPFLMGNGRGTYRTRCNSISGWHADSLGGGAEVGDVPNLDYLAEDCDFVATGAVSATENHGNAKGVTRRNCRITGGISMGGYDATYDRCQINIIGGSASQGVMFNEAGGGKFRIVNCEIFSNRNFGVTPGVPFIDGDSGLTNSVGLTKDLMIEIKGTQIISASETNFAYLRNASPTFNISYDFDFEVYAPNALNRLFRIRKDSTGGSRLCAINPKGQFGTIPYANWENGYSATAWAFPSQAGVREITTVAGASFTDAAFNFPHGYPVAPIVNPSMSSAIGGVPFFVENQGSNPTAAQARFVLRQQDTAANLPAGLAKVAWVATSYTMS